MFRSGIDIETPAYEEEEPYQAQSKDSRPHTMVEADLAVLGEISNELKLALLANNTGM